MKTKTSLPIKFRITALLRSLFFILFPSNTKRYKIAYPFLRNYLIHFRPLNIQYQQWIKNYDSLVPDGFLNKKQKGDYLKLHPIISIIMPVYNPKVKHLKQAIQSALDQTYTHWELCVADDASTDPMIKETLQTFMREDSRIKAVFRKVNGHISAASNSALELAKGDYIALLDHDDVLHPNALTWIAHVISQYPETEVIFSDEDKITKTGKRIEPYFKSDFDYELFLCRNIVSHLGVYKTETIRAIGGFREGLEGSQDYDLMLRVLEKIKLKNIRHVPHVLYHWRISKESVSGSIDVKPYALNAGKQAISEHLQNKGIHASVTIYQKYGYKINYQIPVSKPSVEVFFLNNQCEIRMLNQVQSLVSSTAYESLLVNCHSFTEKTSSHYKRIDDKRLRIIGQAGKQSNENTINKSVTISNADVIAILHPYNIEFSNHWLEQIIGLIISPEIGAVSPQLLYKNGLIFSGGVILSTNVVGQHIFNGIPIPGQDPYFGWASLDKGYSVLPHGCIFVKKEHFVAVDGLNSGLSSEAAQIIDFCLKLKELGLRNVMLPSVQVIQDFSYEADFASKGLIENPSDRQYFSTRWKSWLEEDPAFNHNLIIHRGRPIIAKCPDISLHTSIKE